MSLVNVTFHAKRALVCVDTEGGYKAPDGTDQRGECSKMVALSHLPIVFAVRGVNYTLSFAYVMAAHAWPATFEGIASGLPSAMLEAIKQARTGMPGVEIGKQEIVMVGHCSTAGRIRAIHFWVIPGGEVEHREMEPDDVMLSPWADEWGEPFEAHTADTMRMAAMEQIRRAKAIYPEAPLGGRLLLAEVTKDAVNMRQLATIPAFVPTIADAPRISKFMRGLIGR